MKDTQPRKQQDYELEKNVSRTNIKYITQCPPCLRHANSELWVISDHQSEFNWIMKFLAQAYSQLALLDIRPHWPVRRAELIFSAVRTLAIEPLFL